MGQKYEFSGKKIRVNGHILNRIVALRDLGDVKAGDLGGWIETRQNLSDDGDCWVYDNAKVYGSANVSDDAEIYDNAQVYGFAKVSGHASVCGNAEVFDSAKVYNYALVGDDARVFGDARVNGEQEVNGKEEIGGSHMKNWMRITEGSVEDVSRDLFALSDELGVDEECIFKMASYLIKYHRPPMGNYTEEEKRVIRRIAETLDKNLDK